MTHTVTEAELEKRCDWLMKRNKRILLQTKQIDAAFYFSKGEGSLLYQLDISRAIARQMNSGDAKRVIFSLVRLILEQEGYDSLLFSSDTNMFKANERGAALSPEELHRLTDSGFKRLQSEGYGEVVEAVIVTAQAKEVSWLESCIYSRDAEGRVTLGETHVRGAGMYHGGRSQMFGEYTEPGMKEMYMNIKSHLPKGALDVKAMTTMVNIAVDTP